MYYSEHGVPHFHVRYGGHRAVFSIAGGSLLAGQLPPRALQLVQEWAAAHRDELALNWRRARRALPLVPVDPLP